MAALAAIRRARAWQRARWHPGPCRVLWTISMSIVVQLSDRRSMVQGQNARAISPRQNLEPTLQGTQLTGGMRVWILSQKTLQNLTAGEPRLGLESLLDLNPVSNGFLRDRHQRTFAGSRCSV